MSTAPDMAYTNEEAPDEIKNANTQAKPTVPKSATILATHMEVST